MRHSREYLSSSREIFLRLQGIARKKFHLSKWCKATEPDSCGFPALHHLKAANWDACAHTWTRVDRTGHSISRVGFHGPFRCLAGVRGDEFAEGLGRGGSMVSGRSADLDCDA